MTMLDAVGNTPIVELARVVPDGCARVMVKLESHNPTGSMKDRMARAVIEGALARGALQPGDRLVEYTGGSTGTSLAFACAAMGYPLTIVTSDAFSQEKRDHMRALGAELIELPSDRGLTTPDLIRQMIARAEELSAEPRTFFVDQFNNPDAASGYASLAEEIWAQTDRGVDAVVQSVGTAQCITGLAAVLRPRSSELQVVAVEPSESPVLAGGEAGPHRIEGVGPGFVPPAWVSTVADELMAVSTDDAVAMTRRLARDEGLFAGTSTGANVVAAVAVAERLGVGSTVVTIACDSGLKYLTTEVYATA